MNTETGHSEELRRSGVRKTILSTLMTNLARPRPVMDGQVITNTHHVSHITKQAIRRIALRLEKIKHHGTLPYSTRTID
jgi:hypothetical protein